MKKLFKGVRAHPTKRQWFSSVPLLDGRVTTPSRSTEEEAARDYDNVLFYCYEWATCRKEFNFPLEWEDPSAVPAATEATLKIKAKIEARLAEGLVDPAVWKEARECQQWRDVQKDTRQFSARMVRMVQYTRPAKHVIADLKQRWEELIFEIERHAV